MPYERDPSVLAWFEESLTCPNPQVRWNAVALLEHVDCEQRAQWLDRALKDKHSQVRSTARLALKALAQVDRVRLLELCESDFMDEVDESDLHWEWEYCVVVIRGMNVPAAPVVVWTAVEDDQAARKLALMKDARREDDEIQPLPVIVQRRAVTQFTRSPRSSRECQSWIDQGRPTYRDGCGDI